MRVKMRVPEPKIDGDKLICPDCNRDFPNKQAFTLHWMRKHTIGFNRPKFNRPKLRKPYKLRKKYTYQKKPKLPSWTVNFCPSCGTPLNPVNMALNITTKHENQK